MTTKIITCERCQETLIGHPESPRRLVPVVYGETNMTICYSCAVELTLMIGHWLGTEPPPDYGTVSKEFTPTDFFKKLAEYFETGMWVAHDEGALEMREFEEAQAILKMLERIAKQRET